MFTTTNVYILRLQRLVFRMYRLSECQETALRLLLLRDLILQSSITILQEKWFAQVTLAKGPPVEARKVYRAAKQCKPENAIRFWGCYTDGGCDLNRRQYWVCAFW
jgi:hypothetical protein